ncbi:MAG: MFS transporter [Syntrophales bacterium]|nr:MFS transporter [Syntrophales bacterium]
MSINIHNPFTNIRKTEPTDKGVFFIAVSQFGLAFCFNVVVSFLPFYIISISPYKPHETMIWIGLILGLNSFIAAAAAPFWGSLTSRFRPKRLYQRAFLCNAIIFLLMGFTSSLPMLLALRLIQGALGGASTIALYMISQLSPEQRLSHDMSLFQNSMTAGQLLGPPIGAYAAAHLGYHSPFVLSFAMVGVSLLLCHLYVDDIPKQSADQIQESTFNRRMLWGWILSFIATVHLTFLPSILPHILEGFQLVGEKAIKSAGFIMMGYTATAIIGNFVISRHTSKGRLKSVIAAACLLAALLQVLLYFSQGLISFTAIRMLQTGIIASVIPLTMANFASEVGGTGLGFLNSARFAGNGFGPLMATSIIAFSNLFTLYMVIAATTAGSVLAFLATSKKKTK